MKQSGVYLIEGRNGPKLARYVGSTRRLQERWTAHSYDLRRNCHPNYTLQIAWNLWGPSCFTIKLLEEIPSDKSDKFFLKREQSWIEDIKPTCNIMPAFRSDTDNMKRVQRRHGSDSGWRDDLFNPMFEPADDFMRPRLNDFEASLTKVARRESYAQWQRVPDDSVRYEDFVEAVNLIDGFHICNWRICQCHRLSSLG